MARHVIGLNHCAIGIENVGGTIDTPLTKKQLKANIKLVNYLKQQYPKIDYSIVARTAYPPVKNSSSPNWVDNWRRISSVK